MGVTVGDIDALMSHTIRDGYRTEAHVDQQRYMTVPLRYNYDTPEKARISRVFGY